MHLAPSLAYWRCIVLHGVASCCIVAFGVCVVQQRNARGFALGHAVKVSLGSDGHDDFLRTDLAVRLFAVLDSFHAFPFVSWTDHRIRTYDIRFMRFIHFTKGCM